ncbi:MAG TPA: hypothetical protein ENK55_05615, partial [Actinobacteria bacterium]|nr:hypothetical protein [Actinomycetota bacterium]
MPSTIIVFVLLAALVVAVVGLIVAVLRNTRAATGPAEPPEDRVRPPLADFHVRGEVAEVTFAVPLPEGEVDPVLRDLLSREAMDVLRAKRAHGLPLDEVRRVRVLGRRDGEAVEVGVFELPAAGEFPEVRAPDLVPRAAATTFDPLAHVGESELVVPPPTGEHRRPETLPPIAEELRFTAEVEALLRAQGIDPTRAELEDLVLGLLRGAGYTVTVGFHGVDTARGGKVHVFTARKGGRDTLVVVVPHRPGEYPELEEDEVNRFLVWFAQANPAR